MKKTENRTAIDFEIDRESIERYERWRETKDEENRLREREMEMIERWRETRMISGEKSTKRETH